MLQKKKKNALANTPILFLKGILVIINNIKHIERVYNRKTAR